MKINTKLFLALLFIAGVGICTGSFLEVGLSDEIKASLSHVLGTVFQSTADMVLHTDERYDIFFEYFLRSVKDAILPVFLVFLSGFVIFLLPFVPFYILLKGVFIGFSSTMLIEAFGIKGILYIAATLVPQNIIQLPIFCLLGVISVQCGKSVAAYLLPYISSKLRHSNREYSSLRSIKKLLYAEIRFYILAYLVCVSVLCISVAIQAFLLPTVF